MGTHGKAGSSPAVPADRKEVLMKFIILHGSHRNDSYMIPVDRIRFVEQERYGSTVAAGNGIPYDSLCVRETVEEIHKMIKEAQDI